MMDSIGLYELVVAVLNDDSVVFRLKMWRVAHLECLTT